jgi:AraC-like DNA-binding protein
MRHTINHHKINIPGYRPLEAPGATDAARLQWLRPFVRQSGNQKRPPWFLDERKLLDYVLVFVASGTGRFKVAGKAFDVGPGDLVWVPPNTPHTMRGYPPLMHCLYVHFDLLYDPQRSHWDACIPGRTYDFEACRRYMHPPIHDPLISSWRGKLPIDNPTTVETLLSAICFEHCRSPSGSALVLAGLMLQLLAEIMRGMTTSGAIKPAHVSELRKTEALIQECADRNLNVAELAGQARLSCSHFRRLFQQTYGESPRHMHRRARMRRAAELLVYSNLNISEIANALGFSTVHNLSRAFRDLTGIAPTRYRQGGGKTTAAEK